MDGDDTAARQQQIRPQQETARSAAKSGKAQFDVSGSETAKKRPESNDNPAMVRFLRLHALPVELTKPMP